MLGSFFWHSEISIFYPQMKYFFKNVNMEFSKMAVFWGVRSEIDFERKAIWICPICWIRVKTINTQLFLTFFL